MRMSFLRRSNCAGFSLMEVAVGLTVLGLLMAGFLAGYRVYQKVKAENVTEERLALIEEAIGTFYSSADRYPRPTPFTLTDGADGYGREIAEGAGVNCSGTAPTGAVVCKATNVPRNVLIGSIPFMDLNLPEESIKDGWGNKFTYAVSETLADSNTGNDVNEVCVNIQSMDQNGAYLLDDCGTEDDQLFGTQTIPYEDIVIVSHGRDGFGAWNGEGKIKVACGTAIPNGNGSAGVQEENCDFDGTFVRPRAIVDLFSNVKDIGAGEIENIERATRFVSVSGTSATRYNDDILSVDIKLDSNYWTEDAANPVVKNNVGVRVGIGTSSPAQGVDVDINGGIKSDANIAKEHCTYKVDIVSGLPVVTEKDCFKTDLIASPAGMQCYKGSYLIGVYNKQVVCEPPAPEFKCTGTDTIAVGFDANGRPICQDPNNPSLCVPATQTRNTPCPPGQGGNITEESTYSCPGGTWSAWTVLTSDCQPVVPDCAVMPPEPTYGPCVSDGEGAWTCCYPNEPCEPVACQASYP